MSVSSTSMIGIIIIVLLVACGGLFWFLGTHDFYKDCMPDRKDSEP